MNRTVAFSFVNGVTLLRFLLTGGYVFVLLTGIGTPAVIALVIIATDFIDGFLARSFKVTSRFGAVLDTLADTVFVWITWYILYLIINSEVSHGTDSFAGAHFVFPLSMLIFLIGERVVRGLAILGGRLRRGRLSVEHLISDKIIACSHYVGILWILFSLPLPHVIMAAIVMVIIVCLPFSLYLRLA